MKILIVSDSHGRTDLLCGISSQERPDMIIHLGDLEDDRKLVEKKLGAPEIPCVFIKGNCDYGSNGDLLNTSVFNLKGHRFFCTHGHLYSVNYSTDRLLYTAEENNCDIVIYGHTHRPCNEWSDAAPGRPLINILNPGSIAFPRGSNSRTYMIMELKDDGAYEVELKTL